MRIRMQLLSDAIPGSGISVAGVIDRDIHYDKRGLPYIPAKRIKGILRESAEILGYHDILELFGSKGKTAGSLFKIDNGHLEHEDSYCNVIDNPRWHDLFTPQAVLNHFTYTRAQTSIEANGIAKENSLRITRVLRKGLTFLFEIECPERYFQRLSDVCRVSRHFGTSRSRGFGEISLELEKSETAKKCRNPLPPLKDGERLQIELRNPGQLILAIDANGEKTSQDYIGGSVLLGAIATLYLHRFGKADERFEQIFLRGEVNFGNLYPLPFAESMLEYTPVPLSIKRVKEIFGTQQYRRDSFLDFASDAAEAPKGVILKGRAGTFFAEKGEQIYTVTTAKSFVSHHRRPQNRHIARATKTEGEFYQFEAIDSEQIFRGYIEGEPSLLNCVKELLETEDSLRLGRSKTGQYGKVSIDIQPAPSSLEHYEWFQGETQAFLLQSDMILFNENGYPSLEPKLFLDAIAETLECDRNHLRLVSVFGGAKRVGGFLGVWKMPKVQHDAFQAGTVFVLSYTGERFLEIPSRITLGYRCEEGFGVVVPYERESFVIEHITKEEKKHKTSQLELFDSFDEKENDLLEYRLKTLAREYFENIALTQKYARGVGNAFLSRINTLLEQAESLEVFIGYLKELDSRIQSSNLGKITKALLLDMESLREQEVDRAREQVESKLRSSLLQQCGDADRCDDMWQLIEPFKAYRYYLSAWLKHSKFENR